MEVNTVNTTERRVEKSAKQAHTADAIVIGGGMAGLAAAIYLAQGGKSVALFERSETLGGRGISQTRAGFKMNLGAHALYDTNPAVEVLRELGVKYTAGSPVGVRTTMAGENYLAPANVSTLLRTKMLNVS